MVGKHFPPPAFSQVKRSPVEGDPLGDMLTSCPKLTVSFSREATRQAEPTVAVQLDCSSAAGAEVSWFAGLFLLPRGADRNYLQSEWPGLLVGNQEAHRGHVCRIERRHAGQGAAAKGRHEVLERQPMFPHSPRFVSKAHW